MLFLINGSLPTPLYQQIKQLIKNKIQNREFKPNEKIPSERELCEELGVSRTTVRQAISAAVNEGLLCSIQGKGTFVASPQIDQGLVRLVGFAETLIMRGLQPSMQVLNVERLPGDVEKNILLGLNLNAEVVRAEVLGLGNREPMALFNYYLPASYGREAVEELKKSAGRKEWFSFTRYYQSVLHLNLGVARQTFEARVAQADLGRLLDIPVGSPVFHITSIMYTADDKPVELRKAYYRGDRYKFNVNREIAPL
jgi:GntR family transcriptional regulator